MSGLADFVKIAISLSALSPQQAGFGIPAILSASGSATWTTAELVRTYSTLAALGVDFATTSPEYLSATRLFAQSPAPPHVIVVRLTTKPALQTKLAIAYASGAHFAFQINGTQVDVVGVTNNDTTVAAIVAACPVITGVSYSSTGSVGSKVVQIDCAADGTFVYIDLLAASGQDTGPMGNQLITLACTTAITNPTVATQLTAIQGQSTGVVAWYELHNPYFGKAFQLAVSDWVETADPPCICIHDEPATDSIATTQGSGTDWGAQAKTTAYVRTAGLWHERPEQMGSIGWAGEVLPSQPGSENWAWHHINGLTGSKLNDTHKANLAARNMSYCIDVGGTARVFFGQTFSGIYLDIVRTRDWTKARMQERLVALLANAADQSRKIPFDDRGGVQIGAEINAVFEEGYASGAFIKGSGIVNIPKVATISSSDKNARKFSGITWSVTLAGAVNTLDISGVIST